MAMRKKVQLGAGSVTTVVLVIAVLVLINLIGIAVHARWDLTEGNLYSLSSFTKKVMRNLDDVILIKLYFTEDLPAPYNANARYIKDQLYEYKAHAGGKMKFEIIDPVKDGKEDEARGLNIPAVQVNAIEKDKIELKRVYMGIAVLYADKREVLPVVQSTRNLEYELTSAIKRVTADSLITIGILGGHGEPSVESELSGVGELLRRQYRVQDVILEHGDLIPDEIQTLLIVGPTGSVKPFEMYAIDQFIMRGGKVGWFMNKVQVDMATQVATNTSTNLDSLMRSYGLVINEDLVIDSRNSRIAIMQRQGGFSFQSVVNYPFFPEAVTFAEENLITKGLNSVSFPYVSSIDTTAVADMGVVLEPIVFSSEHSGRRKAPYNIGPQQEMTLEDLSEAHIPLAATAVGIFPSYFDGRAVPDSGVTNLPLQINRSPVTRMFVAGDGDFMRDRASRTPGNVALFLNAVDWLAQDEGLIAIRSREDASRPLDPTLSDGARFQIKYANILGPPLLVIVFGLVRWRVRKAKRARIAAGRMKS